MLDKQIDRLIAEREHAESLGMAQNQADSLLLLRLLLEDVRRNPHRYARSYDVKKTRHTPEQWCEQTGVYVLDPDGWRGENSIGWNVPIPWDMFLSRFNASTVRIVDKEKYLLHRHLFS